MSTAWGWFNGIGAPISDNGEPLGSSRNPECQIDAPDRPKLGGALSGAAPPEPGPARPWTRWQHTAGSFPRPNSSSYSIHPCDHSALEPGLYQGFTCRASAENGGQYTHAGDLDGEAFRRPGRSGRAWAGINLINTPFITPPPPRDNPRVTRSSLYVGRRGRLRHVRSTWGAGEWTWNNRLGGVDGIG
jgi:cellobiose phosphorylase